ncbi:hypothetical protein ACWD4L_24305 [Streptomyces sp. NPDC002596]
MSFICNTSPPSTAEIGLTISAGTPSTGATALVPNGVQGDLGGIGRMNAAQLVGGTALAVAATTGAVFVVRRRNERYSH